uniref:Ig-like domain-containing protein n=1 Tax=Sparus aurata TaxID=8175 RepID=A0A671X1Y2_SPAAU
FIYLLFSDLICLFYHLTDCPLILTPAEVVVRFGDRVSVDCSVASTTDFLGMGWEAAFGGTGFEQKSSLTWTVEKVEEWNIYPQCYMTQKNGEQCSVTPDITVYKTPDTVKVSAVVGGPMVEGKEYTLVCGIDNVAPVQKLKVIWYRDNEKLSNETFDGTTVTPVNEYSTLTVTADRHHNGALFRCEAVLHLGPELNLTTAKNSSTDITIELKSINSNKTPILASSDAPELIQERGYVTVFEGENAILNCGARGNPPPVFMWTCKGMNISENTTNLTITRATISTTYSCTATNPLGEITKEIHSSLTWTVEKVEEWNIKPQCNMTWKNGKQCSVTPNVTVYSEYYLLSSC